MKTDSPVWFDKSHPNFTRWQRARELSIERGKFANTILSKKNRVNNLSILDLGSGEGGTSKVFSENNFVVSFDLNLNRLQRQKANVISKESSTEKSLTQHKDRFLTSFEMTDDNTTQNIPKVNGNALQIPFISNSFDLIIIQDVIEHMLDVQFFYSEVKRVLKKNGVIYLSTPNKYSLINFLSDPHFGLPFLSILNRESIKRYFLKYFRNDDYGRKDIAQLLSLKEITILFNKDFEINLYTKFAVQELLKGNKGIIWSDFHLKIISFAKTLKLDRLIKRLSNDNLGILNKYFTPTFYFVLTRK
jgi:SAM-dependent methyltransferase